jgi:DNA polymerase III epsilon subunit-like protein
MKNKSIASIIKAAKENGEEILVFNDTETTGVSRTDRILQTAHSVYTINTETNKLKFQRYVEEYIDPPVPISPGSAAVHGIWKKDLEGAPEWSKSKSNKEMSELISAGAYYIAHNSPFDWEMLSREGIIWPMEKVIDTLRIARHVYAEDKEVESKGLQWLRYFFDFDSNEDFDKLVGSYGIERLQAHTALSDIVVLIYFFKFLFDTEKVSSLSEMSRLSMTPIIEDKVTFGNVFEKGSPLSEAVSSTYVQYGKTKTGLSYFNWAIKNMDRLSIDQKYAISYFAIEAAKNGKISITDKDITPMIYIAAAFIPDTWDYLKSLGYDTEAQRSVILKSIEDKIEKKLSEDSSDEEKEEGLVLKKDLEFMNRYVESTISK